MDSERESSPANKKNDVYVGEPERPRSPTGSGSSTTASGLGQVFQFLARKLGLTSDNAQQQQQQQQQQQELILDEFSLDGIAKFILDGKCKNIITIAGAGISTSAGIPDFRSPSTGLYDNLKKFNLPFPEVIFTLPYLKMNPEPFFTLAKELLPAKYKPTPCHYFIRLLNEKGLLLRHYTQNVDTLERVAGLPDEKIVEAHGSFATSHCIGCRKFYTFEWMKERIATDLVPRCTNCSAVVKPDIVFFGERLPARFHTYSRSDFAKCDLLIILGSSLVVEPFASLVDMVGKSVPRLLINRERAGERRGYKKWFKMSSGLEFDSDYNKRDVFWQGNCDEGCYRLVDKLSWGVELRQLVATEHKRLDEERSLEDESQVSTENNRPDGEQLLQNESPGANKNKRSEERSQRDESQVATGNKSFDGKQSLQDEPKMDSS